MAFKMKGPSLHTGTAGHKKLLNLKFTSPLQDTDPTEIKWGKEKKVSETRKKNIRGGEDITTKYETKGTSKGKKVERYAKTPEEIAKWKKSTPEQRAKYEDKTHTKGREETRRTSKKLEPIKIKTKPVLLPTGGDVDIQPAKIKIPEEKTPPPPTKKERKKRPGKVKKVRVKKKGTWLGRTLKKAGKSCVKGMCDAMEPLKKTHKRVSRKRMIQSPTFGRRKRKRVGW